MVMMRPSLFNNLLFLLLCILLCGTAQASLTASVDRSSISENDILRLTIRSDQEQISDRIDLSGLKTDFTILNTQRSNQISIVNGRREAKYDLVLVLAPNRSGTLTIPAFESNGERTRAFQVEVSPGNTASNQELRDVFLDSRVSTPEAYVQEQILFTLQLYHAVGLDDANISQIEVADAVVKPLGEQTKYETILKGIRYSVIELKYAIFPQKSGRIEIPEIVFTGRTASQRFSFSRSNSRFVRAKSATHIINVLPKPDTYPVNQPWLPTWSLSLHDSWSEQTPEFHVGDPVTRTITLSSRGLTAAQLPEIEQAVPNGIKAYPDQPQINDQITNDAIIGQRTLSIAIVPSQEGQIELPGITIPWWNTQTNQLEQARIEPLRIQVLPASQPQSVIPNTAPAETLALDTTNGTTGASAWATSRWWAAAAILFALLWLSTLIFWWRSKASNNQQADSATGAGNQYNPVTSASARQNLKQLRDACRRGDAQIARQALIAWCSTKHPDQAISNLEDVSVFYQDAELASLLKQLQQHLYGGQANSGWQGDALADRLQVLERKPREPSTAESSPLAPLYPQ